MKEITNIPNIKVSSLQSNKYFLEGRDHDNRNYKDNREYREGRDSKVYDNRDRPHKYKEFKEDTEKDYRNKNVDTKYYVPKGEKSDPVERKQYSIITKEKSDPQVYSGDFG
jgi:hypothetical protein